MKKKNIALNVFEKKVEINAFVYFMIQTHEIANGSPKHYQYTMDFLCMQV